MVGGAAAILTVGAAILTVGAAILTVGAAILTVGAACATGLVLVLATGVWPVRSLAVGTGLVGRVAVIG